MIRKINRFKRYKESKKAYQVYKIKIITEDSSVDFEVSFNFEDGSLRKIIIDGQDILYKKTFIELSITSFKRAIFDIFSYIKNEALKIGANENELSDAEEMIEETINDIITLGPEENFTDFSKENAVPELMVALQGMSEEDLLLPFKITISRISK